MPNPRLISGVGGAGFYIDWCINVKKCKIMKITKKIQPLTSSFFLENSEQEEVKEFKDLGIFTNHHLSKKRPIWPFPFYKTAVITQA